jgi:prepilin-type N-terminal cleavage/methylation domain-containing protein
MQAADRAVFLLRESARPHTLFTNHASVPASDLMNKCIARTGSKAAPMRSVSRGFTLIEVMIVVAIIAILAAIALPSYRDYILRGQLVDATNLLSAGRANMERYFQDNRTYAKLSATIYPPCDALAGGRTQGNFTLSCTAPAAPDGTTYTLTAQGAGPVATFTYTVTQQDVRGTTISAGGPWTAGTWTCYVTKKGQTC